MNEEKEWVKFNKEFEKENKTLIEIVLIYIYCERQMNALILKNCPHPDNIVEWFFASKVEFLYSIGIINESLKTNLNKLATIRNRFAHHANASFDDFKEKHLIFMHIRNKHVTKNIKKFKTDEERISHIYFVTLVPLFSIAHKDFGINVGHHTQP